MNDDVKKDNWGRAKLTIWRLYGKERCIKEWGNTLPSPTDIQEYKENWSKKALKKKQYFKCTPKANATNVSKWLRSYGVNKLDYNNVYRDTIIVRDPQVFVILKLHFFEGNG